MPSLRPATARLLLSLLCLLLPLSAAGPSAQDAKPGDKKADEKLEKLDINVAPENARRVAFTTDEGTWMTVDVSPDGRWILFDLLGDLYRVGIAGGKAERITSGPAFDYAPRYSPDGRTIVTR